jgi:hypothetical protein
MGRGNRERRERIQAGLEAPRSLTPREKMRVCNVCRHEVPESQARQHIRDCWHMSIKDSDPIPEQVPDSVWQRIARKAARDAKGEVVKPVGG